jgi:DNA repair protein RecN (Recombination protein N)
LMLLSLRIENFALIDALSLEFTAGLNVLTGEPGAGKSIILDALDALLGGKVSARLIRTGAERSVIEGCFSTTAALQAWLADQEIEPLEEDTLVCSRELILQQGNLRTRSRLNGVVVNRQQLESLREQLLAITAQGQAVQLGQASRQRAWLDEFGGEPIRQQRQQVGAAHTEFLQTQKALETWRQTEQQRLQKLDLLTHQFRELDQAQLEHPDEDQQLNHEQQRLGHSVELQQQSQEVYQYLYEQEQGQASADLLGHAAQILGQMHRIDPQVQPILQLVEEALAQIETAGRLINEYANDLEADPQRLSEIQDRLAQLKSICRKYGPSLPETLAYRDRIADELALMQSADESQASLEQKYQQAKTALSQACSHLSHLRRTAAEELEALLIRELQPLAMEKAQFQVELVPSTPSAQGAEQVRFCFSPNPGEALQPLTETASGGEMSRFLLALQACFVQANTANTLVFDEIDVGVSGRVAQTIAEKLYQLSLHHQVFCVTHQPLVAAMADQHFHVDKQVIAVGSGERTVVRVDALSVSQRHQELAQLAGGKSAGQAMAFAKALLAEAKTLRQQYGRSLKSVAKA